MLFRSRLICKRHYWGNANGVGRQLRYVAELDGQWMALLGWNGAAYHLKEREQGLPAEALPCSWAAAEDAVPSCSIRWGNFNRCGSVLRLRRS